MITFYSLFLFLISSQIFCTCFFRLILLNKLLEDGNTLYRKNRFDEAAHRYGYAVRRIPINISNNNNCLDAPNSNEENSDQPKKEDDLENNNNNTSLPEKSVSPISATFSQLKIHLLLNLSRCQRRIGKEILRQHLS